MKNRLFPIIIGLCLVSLIGVAFLRTQSPKTEAPVEAESVQESVESTDMSQTKNTARLDGRDATPQASLPNIDNIDMDEYKAAPAFKRP